MTVIAWDGKTLAADTFCTTDDDTPIYGDKIWRTPRGLFGGAGDDYAIEAVRAWLVRGGRKPKLWDGADFTGLLIAQSRSVFVMNARLILVEYHPQPFAIGSGALPALAYMKTGHSAPDAVRLVIQHGVADAVGGDVQTLTLRRLSRR